LSKFKRGAVKEVGKELYNQIKNQGALEERERIIDLISSYGVKHNSYPYYLDLIHSIKESKK
jgi:hypothetical protein